MTELLALLAGAATTAGTYHLLIPRRRREAASWLESATATRVLVNLVDGQTIEGSLVRTDADGIALEAARHADANQTIAGATWIPREQVAWIQQPTRKAAT